jgi:hypothetical protein
VGAVPDGTLALAPVLSAAESSKVDADTGEVVDDADDELPPLPAPTTTGEGNDGEEVAAATFAFASPSADVHTEVVEEAEAEAEAEAEVERVGKGNAGGHSQVS